MYGSDTGMLMVGHETADGQIGVVWTRENEQGNEWKEGYAEIRSEGTAGATFDVSIPLSGVVM